MGIRSECEAEKRNGKSGLGKLLIKSRDDRGDDGGWETRKVRLEEKGRESIGGSNRWGAKEEKGGSKDKKKEEHDVLMRGKGKIGRANDRTGRI